MSSGPIAFATEELYPFSPGGIGRLIHHLTLKAVTDRSVHLFLASTIGVNEAQVQDVFGPRVSVSRFDAQACDALSRSRALEAHLFHFCQQHAPFEWIEVPDFRGLGFATLHRAATHGIHGEPRLHLRVHGPNSLIGWHEGRRIDAAHAAEFDLERSSLLLADAVIAPLAPVRDAVATFFHFDEAWRSRVHICMPPRSSVTNSTSVSSLSVPQRIIFPTKVQGIKRPDLFIDGVTRLMTRRKQWLGQATFAAHRNAGIEKALQERIPLVLRDRFEWVSWDEDERRSHIAAQIVVIPSDFETLSLAAWEAADVGARVVASTRCPAFAPDSPWATWPGFHGFDGTVEGLFKALEGAIDSPPPPPFQVATSPLLEAPAVQSSTRRQTPLCVSEIEILVGGPECWSRRISSVTQPWVLLLMTDAEADPEEFCMKASVALSRRSKAKIVASFGTNIETPTQAWAPRRRPTGPIVVPTELAKSVLSPQYGRRSVLAAAIQLGMECLYLFVPTGSPSADEENFPPPFLDAHPMALRAFYGGQPPLRTQIWGAAKAKVSRVLSRSLQKFRNSKTS